MKSFSNYIYVNVSKFWDLWGTHAYIYILKSVSFPFMKWLYVSHVDQSNAMCMAFMFDC